MSIKIAKKIHSKSYDPITATARNSRTVQQEYLVFRDFSYTTTELETLAFLAILQIRCILLVSDSYAQLEEEQISGLEFQRNS